MLVEPPESDKVSVEAEESPGEEDWAADDEVDADAPAAVWATEPPAAEVWDDGCLKGLLSRVPRFGARFGALGSGCV